ncbi:hypothetical protein TSAR_003149 [Trichomalopsis sarcophagae]|uniref:Uncharacterized protein n=1 Tax=Trichomalopsis sarcophagae TaxID=543379 RepID=A0A232F0U4_9HYME|nr:hypothetical protein TSAR_003149 [Trichomalopsis sarcophagae]
MDRISLTSPDYEEIYNYYYEVGGWAPPTELSQLSGAAAHTYTWFSLKTYLLTSTQCTEEAEGDTLIHLWIQFLFARSPSQLLGASTKDDT